MPDPYAEQCGWKKDWLYDSHLGQRLEWKVPRIHSRSATGRHSSDLVLLDPGMARVVAKSIGRQQGTDFENVDQVARDLASAGASKTVSGRVAGRGFNQENGPRC